MVHVPSALTPISSLPNSIVAFWNWSGGSRNWKPPTTTYARNSTNHNAPCIAKRLGSLAIESKNARRSPADHAVSVMLASNLPFSQWTAIFKDPMTTAAAIDRLVHHSVIVELNVPSYRLETAKGA